MRGAQIEARCGGGRAAAITDLEPKAKPGLTAICNWVIPLARRALGPLACGFTKEFLDSPKRDVFAAIAAASALFARAACERPEPAPRHAAHERAAQGREKGAARADGAKGQTGQG